LLDAVELPHPSFETGAALGALDALGFEVDAGVELEPQPSSLGFDG
jgi:hypothetical protein